MLDEELQKALLFMVIHNRQWESLITYGIDEKYFTGEAKLIYNYTKNFIDKNEYPSLKVFQIEYEIDDDEMARYISFDGSAVKQLCEKLKEEYFRKYVKVNIADLNERMQSGLENNPQLFSDEWDRLGLQFRLLSYESKSADLLDNIDNILSIDPTNVIPTGFEELNDKLIGWKRGEELVVLVGRTGQGKSWLGLKFAFAAATNGETVGIYSGEMSKEQLQERMLCIAKPTYTSTKEEALNNLKENNVHIKILTQAELRRRANIKDIEEFIVRDKLDMLIVDQLSLMDDCTSKPGTPLRQQYGNISMDLFTLSTKYNIPIILLVQSNRQGGQEANAPGLDNIAESDAVAQNATRVISMRNENGILTLQINKNRYGDSNLTQKYEVDYGINKFKPIREVTMESVLAKKAKGRQIFGGGSKF